MNDRKANQSASKCNPRREFLKQGFAAAAAAALTRPLELLGQNDGESNNKVRSQNRSVSTPRPRVVQISDGRLIPVRIVQRSLLAGYLGEGLRMLTGAASVADAWHEILDPDDIVLIKFNRSSAETLGTRTPFAAELVHSLVRSDWDPKRIMLLEEGPGFPRNHKTRPPDYRWQGEVVHFGASGRDSFIAALDQATAIINVPFLKTHHRATMTSCLKNLSHGLIRHPSRFHANECDPAIAEIVASPQIKSKLKLNIVNGLRVVFDGGPDAGEDDMVSSGLMLMSRDPAACDAVGFGILNKIRSLHQLPPLLGGARLPRQLVTAAKLGIGRIDAEHIDLQVLAE